MLVIKTSSRSENLAFDETLRAMADGRDDIVFFDGYIPGPERTALIAAADALVSLHRSEGYGLTMAEAMAVGTLAIGTGYSGNLSFMSDQNSVLVPYNLVNVPANTWPYPSSAQWAEPKVGVAASLMRRAATDGAFRESRITQAHHDVRTLHTVERTTAFVTDRLAAIAAMPTDRPR